MENLDVYSILRSEKNYIQYWMSQNEVVVHANGIVSHPQKISFSSIKDRIYSDYKVECDLWNAEQKTIVESHRKTVKKFLPVDVDREFSILIDNQRLSYREEFKNSIKFIEESGEVAKFLNLFCDGSEEDIACFKHWMWNVKRSVFGLKRKQHLMLNFLGGQNSGKTYNLGQMFEKTMPDFFFVEKDLKNLFDERRGKIFNNNFVAFLDEMAGSNSYEQKNMIRDLKQKISEDDFLFRPMRSNDYDRLSQNCSFISATNESLEEILNDSTGMRRFWEIKVTKVVRQPEMDTVDFTKFWTEIDENKDNGYVDLNDLKSTLVQKIIERQQETVSIDIIKEMLDENGVEAPKSEKTTQSIKCSTLYKMYQMKCQEDGVRYPDTANMFGRKLKRYGILSKQIKKNGKNNKYYLIEQCDIDESKYGNAVL